MELNAIGCDPAQSAQQSASNGIELPVQSKLVIQFRSASISFTSVRVKCWSSMSDWINLFWNWIGIRCRYWFYLLKFCLLKKRRLCAHRVCCTIDCLPKCSTARRGTSNRRPSVVSSISSRETLMKVKHWFDSNPWCIDLIWFDWTTQPTAG